MAERTPTLELRDVTKSFGAVAVGGARRWAGTNQHPAPRTPPPVTSTPDSSKKKTDDYFRLHH